MEQITVQDLKKRMDQGEALNIIDVREPSEYQEFNIGATLMPLSQVMSMQIDAIADKKQEEIIVHCRSGQRSTQAAMFLEAMGFSNVKNLQGGMMEWQRANGK